MPKATQQKDHTKLKHPADKDNILVTGGAGFIGSHIVDQLMQEGYHVTVLDNLTNGNMKNLEQWTDHPDFSFIKADLKNAESTKKAIKKPSMIFHLAANPEVRIGETDPQIHFEENLRATFNLLEAIKTAPSVKTLVFTSTSTIYGKASVLPTPENYGPLLPISTYGATKLGCEALISSYAHTFDFRALILRLANIVGPRSNHGVVIDFIEKLRQNPRSLEILGDGTQNKSYMYISDCVEAMLHLTNIFIEGKAKVDAYNVGPSDRITVKKIANTTVHEMALSEVKYVFKHEAEGGVGWKGDLKDMHLSIKRLIQTGWKPKYSSEQAVQLAAQQLLLGRKP